MAEWFCSGKKVLARHEIATTIVDIRKRLDQIQGAMKVFIVVDDIWDGKIWVEAIEQAFVASNPGSRIIVTTRKSEVAKNIGVDEQYPIQPLSEGYSKMLLSKISGIEDKLLDHDDVVKKF
ncbi:hypothetical protein HU200_066265 [Digitaria exilis]|uniref:NB-ARC domain-containing protein n=1 Tax=Digitaria exilis TaxID=1010633 RepID=A0A835A2H1_9POAL|nr:hypothetical protein HU200_066265 [Digitaria exilis]